MTLSAYNCIIKYKYGKQQGNVDVLNRFALPDSPAFTPTLPKTVTMIVKSCQLFYYASKITKQTEQYPTLLKVKYYTKLG